MVKHVQYLRTRAYREGQRAKEDERSPYFPGTMLDQAWHEGHKDVHVYGIKKFRPTPNEKAVLLFLGGVIGIIAVVVPVVEFINR